MIITEPVKSFYPGRRIGSLGFLARSGRHIQTETYRRVRRAKGLSALSLLFSWVRVALRRILKANTQLRGDDRNVLRLSRPAIRAVSHEEQLPKCARCLLSQSLTYACPEAAISAS